MQSFFSTNGIIPDNRGRVFEFNELFCRPVGIPEYISIVRQNSNILISNAPQILHQVDEDIILRLRNFIDIAYARYTDVRFDVSIKIDSEMSARIDIKRLVSRLNEMASSKYHTSAERIENREFVSLAQNLLAGL